MTSVFRKVSVIPSVFVSYIYFIFIIQLHKTMQTYVLVRVFRNVYAVRNYRRYSHLLYQSLCNLLLGICMYFRSIHYRKYYWSAGEGRQQERKSDTKCHHSMILVYERAKVHHLGRYIGSIYKLIFYRITRLLSNIVLMYYLILVNRYILITYL